MNEQEALKEIMETSVIALSDKKKFEDAMKLAISALEKQIPKKPITYKGTNRADCPTCNATVREIKEPFGDWCSKCGQKLDWSE